MQHCYTRREHTCCNTTNPIVSMFGQRRIRLTSIEPAMGCDAGPTLNRYWVGRPSLCVPGTEVHRIDAYTDLSAMVMEGIGLHVEDILLGLSITRRFSVFINKNWRCLPSCSEKVDSYPANTGHAPNAVSMLGQRRRRWANIETALCEYPVFAG